MTKVVPIYKNGDKHIASNYSRHVSLLPQFSKILEKLFVNRLDDFIEKYELLSDHQYGFGSNRSTSLVAMDLIENIANAVEKKQNTVGVFIDLRKVLKTLEILFRVRSKSLPVCIL